MVFILLLGGYGMLLSSTVPLLYNRRQLPLLAIVELVIYLCLVGMVFLLYVYYTYDPWIIYESLLVFAMIIFAGFLWFFIKNRRTNNYKAILIFGIYLIVIFYLTIFMRAEGNMTASVIKMDAFCNLRLAISEGSLAPLEHEIMNVFLFLPLGGLIPLLNLEKCKNISMAVLCGMMVSTGIETVQLVAHLGECDINDIISNTLGALLGYLFCRMLLQIRKNWKI